MQEETFQGFEELLPYELFSIRLSNAELPQLREILRSITPEQCVAPRAGWGGAVGRAPVGPGMGCQVGGSVGGSIGSSSRLLGPAGHSYQRR